MRLTCPNCDAQYEVPDQVIPAAGRDVQCSNCGQTWFQHHPDNAPPEDQDDSEVMLDPDVHAEDEEVAPPTRSTPPAPVQPAPVQHTPEPQRKQLDPAVADILRQEAEAEQDARRQRQAESLETQTDLGLEEMDDTPAARPADVGQDAEDDQNQRALEARRRMARIRGESDPEAAASAAALSSRRELLPDIDEINSTLRATPNRAAALRDVHGTMAEPEAIKAKRGFRRGFSLILLVAAALALVYVYAPQIAVKLPQVDPYLSSYVTWVDGVRMSLDGQVQRLLTWLDKMANQSAS